MERMATKVLGIGAAIVDTIVHVEEDFLKEFSLVKGSATSPEADHLAAMLEAVGESCTVAPGGSCSNVIRALAGLGWSTALVSKIGRDSTGRWLIDDLQMRGIESHYPFGSLGTAHVLSLVTPDGERTMCSVLGAAGELQGADLDPKLFHKKQLVHIEGYSVCQEDLALRAMKLAHDAGAAISFDLANFQLAEAYRSQMWELLEQYVTVIFANRDEALAFTGEEPSEACQRLARYCQCAVVTSGKGGCSICSGGKVVHVPILRGATVVDTTGAGDLFSAGFLDGWLSGAPLALCGAQGHFLARAVIQREGACLPLEFWSGARAGLAALCG